MAPIMQRVLSSHILDIGYADGELHVRYAPSVREPGGTLVVYRDVTPAVAAALNEAPSPGSFLRQHVRGHYPFSYPERD